MPIGQRDNPAIPSRLQAVQSIDELSVSLAELEKSQASLLRVSLEMSRMLGSLRQKIAELGAIAAPERGPISLLASTIRRLQEMNQSFNIQYLMLQQDMQTENRQFTLVSNIMKTKHDTAKNAINNVR
jgi:hypothetical protein